jgi:protein-disulfide reductase (glutathione)
MNRTNTASRWILVVLVASLVLAGGATAADRQGHDWNDSQIAWMDFEAGVAEASESVRPICLVIYTEWCPHCKNYAQVFHDPSVVEKSKAFVMIRVERDSNVEISKRYAPDGEYIPRTHFLSSDGELDTSVTALRERYRYFFSESDPTSLLGGMDRALTALGTSSSR